MPENDLHKFRKIIVSIDGSKTAERALKYAVSLASAFGAEIVLFSAIPKGHRSANAFKSRLIDEIGKDIGDTLNDMPASILMETYHQITIDAIGKHNINVRSALKEGGVSIKSILDLLLELMKEERADLFVIASSGKSSFEKLTKGSVIDKLIKISPIPVLVVKK